MTESSREDLFRFSSPKEEAEWIDIQRRDLRLRREFAQSNEWREYNSTAPLIIGEVPEEERDFFASIDREGYFSVDFYNQASQQEEIARLRRGMPRTLGDIERHLALLDDPHVVLDDFSIEKTIAQKGLSPITGSVLHIDPSLYLFSNYSTEFYLGKVRVRYLSPEYAEIDEQSLSTPHVLYTAPPFKIVWKGPWDVHKEPVFTNDGERILGVGFTSDGMRGI